MSRPPIHPGEILADELKDIGVTPTELARQVDVPPNRISEIIRGRRNITGDTALRLGHWFGTAPQFWRLTRPERRSRNYHGAPTDRRLFCPSRRLTSDRVIRLNGNNNNIANV